MARISIEIDRLIEKQIRNWEIARAQRRQTPAGGDASQAVAPFVTISRMVGSGGTEIARRLGERLGWPVFDKDLLQKMAGDDRVRARIYEAMDERDVSWIDSVLHYVCGEKLEPHDYFHRLAQTVLAIARGGNAIFVGRGADLLLPDDCGLRLRIIAPKERCIQAYAERHGLDHDAAAREIERIVKERDAFIRRYFHRDPTDPARYDLVLNLARLTPDDAVELAVAALNRRGVSTTG